MKKQLILFGFIIASFLGIAQPNYVQIRVYPTLDSSKLVFKNTTGLGYFGLVTNDYTFITPNGTYYSLASISSGATGTISVARGGTNITSYAVGDILYASGSTTLSKLADVATGNALISGGVTTAPSWGKIGLTTHVSGTLPVANGGSGSASGAADFEYIPFGTGLSIASINNTAYAFLFTPTSTITINAASFWINAAGSGNGIDIAIYDYAGTTLLASKTTPLSSVSTGWQNVTFDAAVTLTGGTAYWFEVANANGAGATFLFGQAGVNDTGYARVFSSTATCGATLGAGVGYTGRLVWKLIRQ